MVPVLKKVKSLDTIEPIATSVLCQFMTIKTGQGDGTKTE